MSDRKMYQTAGILWLMAVLTFFVSLMISIQYDIPRNYFDIDEFFSNSQSPPRQHLLGLAFGEFSFFGLIAVAAPLYIIFRRFDTTFALMGTLLLSAGGIVGAVTIVGNLAITQLGELYLSNARPEAVAIKAAALAIISTANWGLMVSALLISYGSIIFNYLIVFQGAGAKWLGWFGLVASALMGVAVPITLKPSLEQLSDAFYLLFLIWAVVYGVWLLCRKSNMY